MPFKTMSASAFKDWERYYKDAKDQYPDDDAKASATAWMIFGKSYKKGADGQWVKEETEIMPEGLLKLEDSKQELEALFLKD